MLRHPMFRFNSVEELSARAVFKKDKLSLSLDATAIALDDIGVLKKFVDADLFLGRLVSFWIVLEISRMSHDESLKHNFRGYLDVDLLHGASLSRASVDKKLDLGKGALAEDLHEVPALDELSDHLDTILETLFKLNTILKEPGARAFLQWQTMRLSI